MIAFDNFAAPFTSSRKEADQCILPSGLTMPTVVIESGWTRSRPSLLQTVNLWLRGGAGSVQLVLITNWSKLVRNRVKGVVEVYNLNAGNVKLVQVVVIINLSYFIYLADKKYREFVRDRLQRHHPST